MNAPAACLLAFLAAGCLGTRAPERPHLYAPTLRAVPGERRFGDVDLLLRTPRLRPELDDERLLARVSEEQVEYYETHRWAAPLDELLRSVLAEALRPAFRSVESDGPGTWELVVRVEHFEELDAPDGWYAWVALRLELVETRSGEVLHAVALERRRRATERNPEAVVESLRLGLEELLADWSEQVSGAVAPPG